MCWKYIIRSQGLVVQSIVSLTKSLVSDSSSLPVCIKSRNFLPKRQKFLTFFFAKNGCVFAYNSFEMFFFFFFFSFGMLISCELATLLVLNKFALDAADDGRSRSQICSFV